MIINNLLNLIGGTPLYALKKYPNVFVKLEKFNLGGSIKDRVALSIIENAELTGILKTNMTILEPTSGNTGIALALIAKLKGYKATLIMPNNMSEERKSIMKAYGANLIFTDPTLGMKGAIDKANEIYLNDKDQYFLAKQFESQFNIQAHYNNTANEISKDLHHIDTFIAGVGTAGSLIGIGKKLKEINNKTNIIGVEPLESAVLSNSPSGKHGIQGIGAGFIPPLYDKELVDEVITVETLKAIETTRLLANEEGLLLGISSGANIYAAINYSINNPKKIIVTLAPDGGEKYLSMGLFGDIV